MDSYVEVVQFVVGFYLSCEFQVGCRELKSLAMSCMFVWSES